MNYPVLDKGYVKLIGTMQSASDDEQCAKAFDDMVVEAARVSYGGGLKSPEQNKKLLAYLIEHEHGTPFEMVTFKFELKLPIYVMRELLRHRWSSFNEISGRYTEEIATDYYVPESFRAQGTKNKQGSTNEDLSLCNIIHTDDMVSYMNVVTEYKAALNMQRNSYNNLIRTGVAKELARGVLGTAFYTKCVWSVNARALINFLILRCDEHAQWEMRQYAFAVLEIFKTLMPNTYNILQKHLI